MHTFADATAGSGVPAFLAKLWRLVDEEQTNELIKWSSVSTTTSYSHNMASTFLHTFAATTTAATPAIFI